MLPASVWLLTLIVLAPTCPAAATTYHVRPDGGSPAECTGTSDAAYPGSGTGLACAWDHPFRALSPDGTVRIAAGDTLVIGAGSYRMGHGAPGAESCDDPWAAFDCTMPPPPSGLDAAHPTRLLGAGWDTGCASPPELWGAERSWQVLDLTGASHVVVACLEITDHSGCVEGHSGGLACERDTPPYGDWAPIGLYATDSEDVRLADLDIHGLAAGGIHAGRLADWTLERVRIAANGWVGFDGDVEDDDSNRGNLLFDRVEIAWNGCGETWPGEEVTGCWDQSAGGYGDGLGTGSTGGHWRFVDCNVHHNTSDGIDMLYLDASGSVELHRTVARGNAGDQLKVSGDAVISNSLLVSDCASFEGWPLMSDHCRSGGSAFASGLHPGSQVAVVNSTLAGEGDCLLIAECAGSGCTGAERIVVRSSVLVGATDFWQPFESTCLYWYGEGSLPVNPLDLDWNLVSGVKYQAEVCPQGPNDLCVADPMLAGSTIDAFDGHPLAGSPAVDSGLPVGTPVGPTTVPGDDLDGAPRDAAPDRGAYEHQAAATCTVSCSATVPASALVGAGVGFTASATTSGCSGTPSFTWSFGDGGSAGGRQAEHSYTAPGTYQWSVTVTVDGTSCTRQGGIRVDAAAGGYQYLIPVAAHQPGLDGTQWRTDVGVLNLAGVPAAVALTLVTESSSMHRTRTVPAGAGAEWPDIVIDVFGVDPEIGAAGALHLASDRPLLLASRTYNQTGSGTYGQFLPALAATDLLTDAATGYLVQLKHGPDFRTNIGFANPSGSAVEVRYTVHAASGSTLLSRTVTVPGLGWVQASDVLAGTAGVHAGASARVRVLTSGGRVWAYASVVDRRTGDGTTVPVQVP